MGEDLAWATRELARLIEIPSPYGEEGRILAHLERRLAELGCRARRIPVDGERWELLAGASDRPELLLVAHVDTIRPTWSWSPEAVVEGIVVRGLGAQDDKGGVATLLLLARWFGADLPEAVGLAFTVDEEWGGTGSAALADAVRPRAVVALEGTGGRICTAEAGYVEAWVHVTGRSVHGSLIEEGDNAAVRAARLILELADLSITRVAPHPLLGPSAVGIEEVHAGGPLFAVPGDARIRADLRLSPPVRAEEALAALRDLAVRHGADVELIEMADPFETPPDARLPGALARAVREATGAEPAYGGMPSWTDAHNFVERAGSEAVVYGPGHLREAHRPDEWIDVVEVLAAARVLAELVRSWAHRGSTVEA
ncbi:Acetylornithine deacetylase [bacterium HR12]|nr:Acetylornithine deacetylase [bacterium HR12]